jgi:hypothetical protein
MTRRNRPRFTGMLDLSGRDEQADMRKFSIVVAITVASLLGGCHRFVPSGFEKQGSTEAEYNKDTYECDRDTRQVRLADIREAQDFFNRCMIARGWRVTGTSPGLETSPGQRR